MSEDGDDRVDRELLAGPAWGFMLGDAFRQIPKMPLILAGFRAPPFDVTLPTGAIRHVIADPQGDPCKG
ncbi:MAG TPA: hypothetical protein VGI78_09135 [Acetobacteraceae bacterium]|jgi:hypothetical protein